MRYVGGFPASDENPPNAAGEVHRDAAALDAESDCGAGAVAAAAGDADPQEEQLLERQFAAGAQRDAAPNEPFSTISALTRSSPSGMLFSMFGTRYCAPRWMRVGSGSDCGASLTCRRESGVADVEADASGGARGRRPPGPRGRVALVDALKAGMLPQVPLQSTRSWTNLYVRPALSREPNVAAYEAANTYERGKIVPVAPYWSVGLLLLAVVHEVRGGRDHAGLAGRDDDIERVAGGDDGLRVIDRRSRSGSSGRARPGSPRSIRCRGRRRRRPARVRRRARRPARAGRALLPSRVPPCARDSRRRGAERRAEGDDATSRERPHARAALPHRRASRECRRERRSGACTAWQSSADSRSRYSSAPLQRGQTRMARSRGASVMADSEVLGSIDAVAEAAERGGVAAPVGEHLHVEVEVDRRPEERLDLARAHVFRWT